MKITGIYKCEHCNNKIKWEYILPCSISNSSVEKINKNISLPYNVIKINDNKYNIEIYCESCGRLNSFLFEDK